AVVIQRAYRSYQSYQNNKKKAALTAELSRLTGEVVTAELTLAELGEAIQEASAEKEALIAELTESQVERKASIEELESKLSEHVLSEKEDIYSQEFDIDAKVLVFQGLLHQDGDHRTARKSDITELAAQITAARLSEEALSTKKNAIFTKISELSELGVSIDGPVSITIGDTSVSSEPRSLNESLDSSIAEIKSSVDKLVDAAERLRRQYLFETNKLHLEMELSAALGDIFAVFDTVLSSLTTIKDLTEYKAKVAEASGRVAILNPVIESLNSYTSYEDHSDDLRDLSSSLEEHAFIRRFNLDI
ncbi:hypothetical protein DID77_04575, partial [Candidatus Marinamargulisbacteria bacterium SCGC AG-439-L15]